MAFLSGSETPLPSVALPEAPQALPAPLQPRALTVSEFWLLPTAACFTSRPLVVACGALLDGVKEPSAYHPRTRRSPLATLVISLGATVLPGIAWSTQGRLQDEGFPWAQAPLVTDHTLSLLCLVTS